MKVELSYTEENYLKEIYHLSYPTLSQAVTTSCLASKTNTSPASVNDMMKRLAHKNLVNYEKYKGVTLLKKGERIALQIIRRHRLWEVFLVKKLGLKWDEVHEVAEQLEHIQSNLMIKRLDNFLGNPKVDPHGDPIPDENGVMMEIKKIALSELQVEQEGWFITVANDDEKLLHLLDTQRIALGSKIMVLHRQDFDGSLNVRVNEKEHFLSESVAKNLLIAPINTL